MQNLVGRRNGYTIYLPEGAPPPWAPPIPAGLRCWGFIASLGEVVLACFDVLDEDVPVPGAKSQDWSCGVLGVASETYLRGCGDLNAVEAAVVAAAALSPDEM
jgi:hypothetical protein